jgi:hypothetical protein
MSNIKIKPAGAANTHSVFKDGKLVGEFRFVRDKIITRPDPMSERIGTIACAGELYDFDSNGVYDLGNFAYFKDVKRHIVAHYTSKATRLRPTLYLHGQVSFAEGDTVRLKRRVANDDTRPVKVARLYSDIDGGLRLNDERNGFLSWNVSDLEKVAA